MEQDQQFVEYVLKAIVDNPDAVSVDRTVDEMGVLISVTVHPDDMGKIIGKAGQTAKAVRTLLKVVGAKNDARVNMKIIEPEGGTKEPTGTAAVELETPQQESSHAETELREAQHESDALRDNPDDLDEEIDEATGEAVNDDPPTPGDEEEAEAEASAQRRSDLDEKSPLDDL